MRNTGIHTAIIMDGNGRWARSRGLPRSAGHREGARRVREVVAAAADPALGIDELTLHAFSADNWARPRDEVAGLMDILGAYLRDETARCAEHGVRLEVLGRRDRLPGVLLDRIGAAEAATAGATGLTLRLAIDYSARWAIARSAKPGRRDVVRDVDLLIRTGGEQRLSDFLLWECAYAELHFTPVLWPDFGAADLAAAVADFRGRDRRFGRVLEEAV